jgi:FMN-dependent NADH-azoreductase
LKIWTILNQLRFDGHLSTVTACRGPAVLNTWIDHIVRINKTFAYGPDGLKGLAAGKKVMIVIASGGEYNPGSPTEP